MNVRFIILLLVATFSVSIQATETYKVGIKEIPPFAYKEDGVWKGLSVDVVKELSTSMGFNYKFIEYPDVTSLIKHTSNKDVDFSIAAISMTADREPLIDFTHPYLSTSLGILTRNESSLGENIWWIFKRILIVLTALVVLLYVVGSITDKVDGDDNIRNPHEGAWWALVTFTTTGYGDFVPKTPRGKVLASVWMIASLFLLSLFTSYMASAMTVKKLDSGLMDIGDLYKTKVVTVSGTTSQTTLNRLGVRYRAVNTFKEAMALLQSKKVNAVVYDKVILDYTAAKNSSFIVSPIDRNIQYYAIAIPSKSSLTEKLNLGILVLTSSPNWEIIRQKYF